MKSLYKWQKIVLGVIAFLSFISPWLAKGSGNWSFWVNMEL